MRSAFAISFAGMSALAVAMGIGRFAFTPILPLMLEEGRLSLGSGGMLASANYIGYLVGALGATVISIKPERAIPLGMLLIGCATVAMALDMPLPVWLLLRCIAGIASAWVLISVSAWSLNALASYERPLLNGLVFFRRRDWNCGNRANFLVAGSLAWHGIGGLDSEWCTGVFAGGANMENLFENNGCDACLR